MRKSILIVLPRILGITLLLTGTQGIRADAEDVTDEAVLKEVRELFSAYLDVYNRYLQGDSSGAEYRTEIVSYLHTPLLMSPPASPQRFINSSEDASANFAAFTNMLKRRGVTGLAWESEQYRVLSRNKVLANHVGKGRDDEGNVLYETVSIYLLHRGDSGWTIVLLSPYDLDREFSFPEAGGA